DWRDASLRFASLIRAAGCAEGDRVAIHCSNRFASEFFVALVGATVARAIAVPINMRLAPLEVARICDNAEPALVVSENEPGGDFVGWARDRGRRLPVVEAAELARLLRGHDPAVPADGEPSDDAVIAY